MVFILLIIHWLSFIDQYSIYRLISQLHLHELDFTQQVSLHAENILCYTAQDSSHITIIITIVMSICASALSCVADITSNQM